MIGCILFLRRILWNGMMKHSVTEMTWMSIYALGIPSGCYSDCMIGSDRISPHPDMKTHALFCSVMQRKKLETAKTKQILLQHRYGKMKMRLVSGNWTRESLASTPTMYSTVQYNKLERTHVLREGRKKNAATRLDSTRVPSPAHSLSNPIQSK